MCRANPRKQTPKPAASTPISVRRLPTRWIWFRGTSHYRWTSKKRFSHGFSLRGNYTYSKLEDDENFTNPFNNAYNWVSRTRIFQMSFIFQQYGRRRTYSKGLRELP